MNLKKTILPIVCLILLSSCNHMVGGPTRYIQSNELRSILSNKKEFTNELTYFLKSDLEQSFSSGRATLVGDEIYLSGDSFSSIYNRKDGTCTHKIYNDEMQSDYTRGYDTKEEKLESNLSPNQLARTLYNEFHSEILFSSNDLLPILEDIFLEQETWALCEDDKPQYIIRRYIQEEFDEDVSLQNKIKAVFQGKYDYQTWYQNSFSFDNTTQFTLGVTRSLDDILPDFHFGKIYFDYHTDQ